jgi:hypothetical protein
MRTYIRTNTKSFRGMPNEAVAYQILTIARILRPNDIREPFDVITLGADGTKRWLYGEKECDKYKYRNQ